MIKSTVTVKANGKSSVRYTITWDYNNSRNTATTTTTYTGGSLTLPSTPAVPNSTYYSSFKNWNTERDGSGSTVTTSTTPTGNTTYYAQWNFATSTLQGTTSSGCGSSKYDARDGKSYNTKKVGSLCWMTTNFNLAGGTTIKGGDTNMNTSITLPASSTSGFNSYNTDYVYNSGSISCGNNSPCYSYYSFYTATAHWGTNSVTSGDSPVDICPKNWRLPTKAEFDTLVGTSGYDTGTNLVNNWSAVYSGFYDYSSFYNGGSGGYYWPSTVYNAKITYALNFGSRYAATSDGNRLDGLAIRCVAKL